MATLDINRAAEAVERYLASYAGRGGRTATEVRAHPSGDDMDAIKVWVNLGPEAEGDDLAAWCAEAERAIRAALGDQVEGYALELRADAIG